MTIGGYHGTTAENVRGILARGLRKGSWLSPNREVAEHFAAERSRWNGQPPAVFRVRAKVRAVRTDRSGRLEAAVQRVIKCTKVA